MCGVKPEHSRLKLYENLWTLKDIMDNLSRHTDLCELETSLLTRGIKIGEISKLGWLIGLVKHAI
jgi:hypothetical protein